METIACPLTVKQVGALQFDPVFFASWGCAVAEGRSAGKQGFPSPGSSLIAGKEKMFLEQDLISQARHACSTILRRSIFDHTGLGYLREL